MFGADAFKEDVDMEITNRKFLVGGIQVEIDFCSTLHVHQELKIRDRPSQQMEKMKFLRGNWDSWLPKLIQTHMQQQTGNESLQGNLTPTKTVDESVRATHYIVGETKISLGKKSALTRLIQLENNLCMLCRRKGATATQAPLKAVGIIALAGIVVPPKREFDDELIARMIRNKRNKLPILRRLLHEERVFVFEIESFHIRLEQLEKVLEDLGEKVDAQGKDLGKKVDEIKALLLKISGGK